MSSKQHLLQECGDRCRSKRHAEELFAAIAKTNDLHEQITFLKTCFNHLNARDAVGRTVLHVAVSLGRTSLVRWLLEEYDRLSKLQMRASRQRPNFVEWLNARDAENGWTALHRAVFYGQIDCARLLLQNEATRIYATDKEGLTAFDLANTAFYQFANAQFGGKAALQNGKEKRAEVHHTSSSEADSDLEVSETRTGRTQTEKEVGDERGTEVLVWGTNANHTLGCESDARVHPEALDTFRRIRVCVAQVCLTRFHSIFLSHDGAVYTCGHGRGGRLGHSTDESFILPKRVHVADMGGASGKCVEVTQICASENHTVMIGRNGVAYVCGSNEHGQLGNAQPSAIDGSSQKTAAQKIGSKAVQRVDATQTRTGVLDVQAVRISSSWKGESRLVGACTSRVHSVFWTAHAVFTCGLNQGQLGYAKTQQSQFQPGTGVTAAGSTSELRPVTLLDRPNLAIRFAVCSELATCVYTTDGDMFLLSRFTVKKLPMKLDNVAKLFLFSVTRERENSQTAAGGSKVLNVLLALRSDGELFFWHEATSNASFQRVRRAPNQFLLRFRDCDVVEWSFSDTATQQAFTIELLACTPFGSLLRATVSAPLTPGADYSLHVGTRVPNVQRVTRVFCELLSAGSCARNFSALQAPSIRVDRDRLVVTAQSEFAEQLATQFRELQAGDDSCDLVLLLCRPAGATGPASFVRFFAHRFVVASRCSYLAKLIAAAQPLDGSDSVQFRAAADAPLEIRIEADVDAALFRLLLQFIYSSDCPLFVPGYRVELQSAATLMRTNPAASQSADYFTAIAKMDDDYLAERNASDAKQRAEARTSKRRSETNTSGDVDDVERIVAELDRATLKQDVATKRKAKTKTKSKSKAEKAERARAQDDALGELRNLAVRFGMTEFVRRLGKVRLNERAEVELRHTDPDDDTRANVPEQHTDAMRLHFDRKRFEDLCDIRLQSNDGQLFACHKCVLMARVEYFRHMFIAQSGWREAAPTQNVAAQIASGLPFAAPVCEALLFYLYADELPTLLRASSLANAQPEKTLEQLDLLSGLLIAADHLLLDRLRQLVEYELCELLTLRNAAFMLQMASFYNATQLRTACLEFVRLNIVTFLEQRLLDELPDELLAAVSEYYRTTEPQVAGRALLSSSLDDYPTRSDLAQLVRDYPKQRNADLQALAAAMSQPLAVAASPNPPLTKSAVPDSTAPAPTSPGSEQRAKTGSINLTSDELVPEEETPSSAEQSDDCVSSPARPARRAIVAQPIRIDPPTYDFSPDSHGHPGWSGPKWTSSIRSPTGEMPLSPEVVTTDRSKMVNLRDILAEEQHLASGRPDSQSSTTRSQPIKHKPSQKERKSKASTKTEAETQLVVESPPALVANVNVWDARRARISSGSQSAVANQQTDASRLRQNDFPGLQQAQQQTTVVARKNEQSKVVNFKQLLNAELADAREVARLTVLTSARANLECVEIEEHAIQQLTELYNAENTFDVHITVERVAWDERGKVKLGWVAKKS